MLKKMFSSLIAALMVIMCLASVSVAQAAPQAQQAVDLLGASAAQTEWVRKRPRDKKKESNTPILDWVRKRPRG